MSHWAAAVLPPVTPIKPDADRDCICGDPLVERLRDMVTAGWDQVAASRVLWGDADPDVLVRPRRWRD